VLDIAERSWQGTSIMNPTTLFAQISSWGRPMASDDSFYPKSTNEYRISMHRSVRRRQNKPSLHQIREKARDRKIVKSYLLYLFLPFCLLFALVWKLGGFG
jgi:hypothetical protein